MSPRGRQYLWAGLAGSGLFAWQLWALAQRFDIAQGVQKSNVMQQQLVEQLLDIPAAMWSIAAYLCFGLFAHVGLALLAVWVFRQATALLGRKENSSVAACMVFLAVVLLGAMMLNKWLYPLSSAFADIELLMVQPLSPVLIWSIAAATLTTACLALVRQLRQYPKPSLAVAMVVGGSLLMGTSAFDGGAVTTRSQPDIILMGVDSLRPDFMPSYGNFPGGLTPEMDQALASSVILADARTPLARTFASYMSVLSGENPLGHGARFNLYPRSEFDARSNLAWSLKQDGYTTLLAMDESRFANFDSTFGFDSTVTPQVGALDFVIGGSFDLMATNLLLAAIPASEAVSLVQGNRAAYRSYRDADHPAKVIRALRNLDPSKPLFLISHLCLPHWPYLPGGVNSEGHYASVLGKAGYADSPTQYLRALEHVDGQFGEILDELRSQGRLSNAVVVVMSDHGEDFGLARDRLQELRPDGTRRELQFFGHGSFALSKAQNHVVLGIQRYIDGHRVWQPRTMAGSASIIDLAPTIADVVGGAGAGTYEGISWKRQLDAGTNLPAGRLRFFENGLRSTGVEQANIDERDVAGEMSYLYDIRPDLRFEIRPSLLPEKLGEKQRGVQLGDVGVMTDPAVEHFHNTGNCWRKIDYLQKTTQCIDYPADEPAVAELQQEVCDYYRSDNGFSERWCKKPGADIPLPETARGSL